MKLTKLDAIYFLGSCFMDFGAITQIIKMYSTKSAGDFSLFYVLFLTLGQTLLLPKSINSKIFIWILCNTLGAFLLSIILIGVILYG